RWLYGAKRFHGMAGGVAGTRAFLVGAAFGFGWTPCVGPILAVILTFAAAESTLGKGGSLFGVYAFGFAIPVFFEALWFEGFLSFEARVRRHLHALEIGSGVVMIAMGVLISTGRLIMLNSWLNKVSFFRWIAEKFS